MGKKARKGTLKGKSGATHSLSDRLKSAWIGLIAFLKGLPKLKRIAVIAGGGAVLAGLIAGIVLLVIFLAGPPVTIRLIHPFENPLWIDAIKAEVRTFEQKNRRYRVDVIGMDYGGVNEAATKPGTWDVAIGTSSFTGLEASFAVPAVPFTGSMWGMYYSKDALKAAGISPFAGAADPAGAFASGDYSFSDLEKAFAKLKESGTDPIALGSQFVWPLAIWIQAIMAAGPSLQDASDLPKRDYDLSSAPLTEAIGKFSSYVDSGYVNDGHKKLDWPSSVRAVVNGDAGFCLVNEEFISSLLAPERAKVGYLPLPGSVKRGKAKWAIGSLVFIGRSALASSPGAAKKLYGYFTSGAVASRLSERLSAPFYANGQGPDRVLLSITSVSTHPLMALLKEKFGIK